MGEGPLATELQMRGAVTRSPSISMEVRLKKDSAKEAGEGLEHPAVKANMEGRSHTTR
jgi:hypothetical protein